MRYKFGMVRGDELQIPPCGITGARTD